MWIWWSSSAGDEKLGDGFINCPVCKTRQPAIAFQYREHTSVWFVPIHTLDNGPESYHCRACKTKFAAADGYPYNFSLEPDPPKIRTRCPQCTARLPPDRLRCPECGQRVDE